jgi:hypothetical protein
LTWVSVYSVTLHCIRFRVYSNETCFVFRIIIYGLTVFRCLFARMSIFLLYFFHALQKNVLVTCRVQNKTAGAYKFHVCWHHIAQPM